MQHGFPCKLAGKNSEGNPLKLNRILSIWIEEFLNFEFNYKGNSLNVNKSERNFWVWMEFCRGCFNILFKLNSLFWGGVFEHKRLSTRRFLHLSGCPPEDWATMSINMLIRSLHELIQLVGLGALCHRTTALRIQRQDNTNTKKQMNRKQSYSTGEPHMRFLTLGFFWDTEP